jgi:hypothetical protein
VALTVAGSSRPINELADLGFQTQDTFLFGCASAFAMRILPYYVKQFYEAIFFFRPLLETRKGVSFADSNVD